MDWTKLFKAKGPKLEPAPRIRWFGKLPTYADYYTSPAGEDWAVEFNDWIMKGFEIYQHRLIESGQRRRRLPICGCLMRMPGSGMTVLASIQDYGGDMLGRAFPLCLYVGLPTAQYPGPTGDCSVVGAGVVAELAGLQREVARFLNSPGRFDLVFADREIDLSGMDARSADGSWVRRARGVSLADWFAGARPLLKAVDANAWLRLAVCWGDQIAHLESPEFEPTLRLPLSAGVALDIQLAGWLRWLEARMDIERRAVSLIASGELGHEPGHLNIIARELLPEDFLLATTLAGTLGYVDDLTQAASQDHAGEDDDAAVGRGDGESVAAAKTWLDFVQSTRGAS